MTSIPSVGSPKPSPVSASAESETASRVGRLTPTRTLGLFLATVAVFVALAFGNPFDVVDRALAYEMTDQPTHMDPLSRDPLCGENLLRTHALRVAPADDAHLIVFMGNSQQFSAILPRGGRIEREGPLITSDVFAQRLAARSSGAFAVYNAAAPNQTLVEELWQGIYWFRVATHRPSVLVIASSFDTYRKAGIRAGFQTLLDLPEFAHALDEWSVETKPYADEFTAARQALADRKREALSSTSNRPTVESWLRNGLELLPQYRNRQLRRVALLNSLYTLRIRTLGLTPTTRRHIVGQPLTQNFAALEDLVSLARSLGAQVVLYNAPVNPAVSLFYDDEYQSYLQRLRELADRRGCSFRDFSGAVPADEWGYLAGGPDPIHFNGRGHQRMAQLLDEAFGQEIAQLDKR